jgi:hypothetical protein
MAAFDPRLRPFGTRTSFSETAAEGRALAQAGASRATTLISQTRTAIFESRKAIRESQALLGHVTKKRR